VSKFEIQKRKMPEGIILDVQGDITLFTSPDLRKEILATLRKDAHAALILNLERVNYIDSSGLATLIEGLQESQKKKSRYALFGLSKIVRNVFEIAKLSEAFEIYQDEIEALQSVGSERPRT